MRKTPLFFTKSVTNLVWFFVFIVHVIKYFLKDIFFHILRNCFNMSRFLQFTFIFFVNYRLFSSVLNS